MTLDERQAFDAMGIFLNEYYERAGDDMVTLLADISIEADGQPLDPAAWSDWMRCVERVTAAGH